MNNGISIIESDASDSDATEMNEEQILPSTSVKRSEPVVAAVAPVVRKRKKIDYGSRPGEDSQLPEPFDTDSDLD